MTDADFMPIKNWDHIEFYVGNAKQAAQYYCTTFGFVPVAYAGLETGVRDHASYVVAAGQDSFCADQRTRSREPDRSACATAWRWRKRHCA